MTAIRLITWDSDPLTEDEVRTVEQSTGPLPPDYRHFLLTSNGGRTLAEVRFRFSEFVHSDYLPLDSFAIVEPRFPPPVLCPLIRGKSRRLVRIAACDYSQFLLELTGPDSGSIYYWYYELEDRWDAEEAGKPYLPTDDSLDCVAPSFTAFVDRLWQVPPETAPKWRDLEKSVENYAKYGDDCFAETEQFFRSLTLAELNKSDDQTAQAIQYAANWSQPLTSKLLIDLGVDIHKAVRACTNSFEITRMMIDAGATPDDLQALLLNAATGIAATSSPDENHKIVLHLVNLGVRPEFEDASVLDEWKRGVDQIYGKKILRFLLRTFDFPESIQELIRQRLDCPEP